MKWVFNDRMASLNDWIVYKHTEGHWVTLRKITDDDKQRIVSAAKIVVTLDNVFISESENIHNHMAESAMGERQ